MDNFREQLSALNSRLLVIETMMRTESRYQSRERIISLIKLALLFILVFIKK